MSDMLQRLLQKSICVGRSQYHLAVAGGYAVLLGDKMINVESINTQLHLNNSSSDICSKEGRFTPAQDPFTFNVEQIWIFERG
jgi:hypothetical protein